MSAKAPAEGAPDWSVRGRRQERIRRADSAGLRQLPVEGCGKCGTGHVQGSRAWIAGRRYVNSP
eukprot:41047-Chlamydomonas_euryale.AAC.4